MHWPLSFVNTLPLLHVYRAIGPLSTVDDVRNNYGGNGTMFVASAYTNPLNPFNCRLETPNPITTTTRCFMTARGSISETANRHTLPITRRLKVGGRFPCVIPPP